MNEKCSHCGNTIQHNTRIETSEVYPNINIRVGCRKCDEIVCFKCGRDFAKQIGISNNCLCPKCKSDLGLHGEIDELGEDYYGWGY